ncbi:protein of unknown function DUF29 [Stanieria cyanosphaera PCC 7437]|uniref:DUF29 domain-containing protein n=1 Tax=Stanieria cyanosphaera (strain ATCC 29371 / PCC 7437) TaxID=111780 RepID=K9XYV4_STAC7|nr:DUF29 family protein [Stanieria cyanosphaera]AFZ37693.1 protein of unknown function DUF29 [Stanieria cyanosphaera PCC 7437]
MEELIELRKSITSGNYQKALEIVDELETMSKEDKVERIYSYAIILLLHLIKKEAEKRTTKSWEVSIKNSVERINRINKRRKSGGYYTNQEELQEIIDDAVLPALRNASLEAFEGTRSEQEILQIIDLDLIKNKALEMLDY